MDLDDPVLARRSVRAGVVATWFTLAVLVLYALTPGDEIEHDGLFAGVLAVAALVALVAGRLPWTRWFGEGRAHRPLVAWSVADLTLVAVAIALTGGERSDLFVLYAPIAVYVVAWYPRPVHIPLLAYSVVSYLVAVDLAGDADAAGVVVRVGILAVLAALAQGLSTDLAEAADRHRRRRQEAERRASLLASVAGAGRSLSDLDGEAVLAAVMDTVVDLGFEAADLCILDDEGETYAVSQPRGMPDTYVQSHHPAGSALVGRALLERRTVVADYAELPDGVPSLQAAGFRATIASPVWDSGRIVAVLEGGTRHRSSLSQEEVEAFELLAAQAGRALENARRYETEQRTVDKLTQVQRLKQEFLTTVSHELRTPLTVMSAIGASLERRWDAFDPETRVDLIQRLNANTASLRRIVGELLDFSNFEPARWQADVGPVDLRQLVRDALHRLGSLLSEHVVEVDIDDEAPPVMGDGFLLERAVENLVSNAARHTSPGTKVHVSVRSVDRQVELAVADDGPGIPAADLPHIGSRFFRGRGQSVSRTRGLGLGLAFVTEILDLHGSRLEVDSVEGEGARFSFALAPSPRMALTLDDATQATQATQPAPGDEDPDRSAERPGA